MNETAIAKHELAAASASGGARLYALFLLRAEAVWV
jgi:hypothetical protein